ncbi:MAG TPA: Ig-like domain-containing protein [Burkholderiales bacterium]|nr:Ig-like domain-containing protein [Burkholderiales bacterium]
MHFGKISIALAAIAACGVANAAPTNLAFKAPASNATLKGSIYQSAACEVTGSGISRVDFFLGTTKLNTEGSAPWNCNIDTRQFRDGAYVLRATAYDSSNQAASTQINVTIQNSTTSSSTASAPAYSGTPYSGTPVALPKAFPAVNFDKGGQNVAYRDLSSGNAGGQYRTSEDVDIVNSGSDPLSAYAVNGFQTGEWLAYTVNVPADGKYDIAVNAATNYSSTPAFRVEVDGVNVTGKLSVPSTGSWSSFKWVGKQGVDLKAGKRVLKVVSEAEYFNLNGMSVLASASSTPSSSGPLVSFRAPTSGQTLSKTISGSACEALVSNGSTAIKQVQFFVDGKLLNTELSAPWNCSFDTTKVSDGTRLLRAVATDVNGATGSAEIGVKVANGTTVSSGPTNVAFVAPKNGATISGDINQSSACEVTGTGIARVDFFLGGAALNIENSAPWNCNIPTRQFNDGTYRLRAVAYTSSGGSTTAEIDVKIQNGTTSASTANPDFSCSFESSPTDCGFYEQAKQPGRATLVSTSREGSRAVRLYTQSGDNNVSGSGTWERNDLSLGQALTDCSQGKEQWWAHSVLFPSDYNLPNNGGVVMDFHHTGSSGQANFHVDAMSTGLRLRGYGGTSVDSGRYQVELGPVVRNQWYDFVYHVKWSSGSDGFMHAWVNGVKKLTHYGPTLYSGMGCYLKLANYHDPMGKSSAVIHDRVRRGKTAADVSLTPLP